MGTDTINSNPPSLDKRFPELTAEYSERKNEIYFFQNNQEAYIQQLWELLLVHKTGNLKLFQELKKQYPKDIWEKERMKILDTLPPRCSCGRIVL